jgi:hypothetical protein
VGARRRQPRQSAAADKEQGGLSGTERVREREKRKGWKQNGGAVQPRAGTETASRWNLGATHGDISVCAYPKPHASPPVCYF